MRWVLIDRVGHLAYYILTKISGLNQASTSTQEVRHFSTIKVVDAKIESGPAETSGWISDGWREDDLAAVHTIENTGTVSMVGDKTIYAVYRRNATFYSGLNKASSATATQYYNTTNKYSLLAPSAASASAITGFTAKNWVSSGGTAVAFGDRYTDSANTFYAKYERTATFYHGVNKAANITATQTYLSDDHYTLSTPATSKATNIGNGWSVVDWIQRDDNAHVNGATTYTGSRNVFYAYYKRTITINYSANGGTGTTAATTGTSYYDSSNAISSNQLTLALNGYSRTGYAFNGWDLGAAGGKVTFAVGDAASKTATAQWAGFTYTVKYAQGTATSGWNATTYAQQSATYPTNITLRTNSMTKSNTEKSGSKFTLTFNANGGSVSPTSASSYIPIKYTANSWTTTSGSTTRTHVNGAAYNNTTTNGSTLTLYPCFTQAEQARTSITMPTPSKTNMTCTGWFTASSGGQKAYSCGTAYNNVTSSRTVYAQWTNTTVNVGGGSTQFGDGYGDTSGGSENYFFWVKYVFKVKFQLLAGKTWQNMIDNAEYKWPTYFWCKRGRNKYPDDWTDEWTYNTRAALKAAAEAQTNTYAINLKECVLSSAQMRGTDYGNGSVDGTSTSYKWYPSYADKPTTAACVFFKPQGAQRESSKWAGGVNFGYFATGTNVVHVTRSYSSGSWDVYIPKNPVPASNVINTSDVGKFMLYTYGDVSSRTLKENGTNYTFKYL